MNSIFKLVLPFLLHIQLSNAGLVGRNTPCGTVSTTSGPVTGQKSAIQPGVSEYLGIPFAKPPVGTLRWAAPQSYTGKSPINATEFVSVLLVYVYLSVQRLMVEGSETVCIRFFCIATSSCAICVENLGVVSNVNLKRLSCHVLSSWI
jgi:hypothetical protein